MIDLYNRFEHIMELFRMYIIPDPRHKSQEGVYFEDIMGEAYRKLCAFPR